MEKNNFTERQELEQTIESQKLQINLLLQSRNFDKKFHFSFNVIMSIALLICVCIIIKNGFKGDLFVVFFTVGAVGVFMSNSYLSYRRIKVHNEDYIDNYYLKLFPKAIKDISTDSLKIRLNQILETEDYELAALIRDELKTRV